MRVDDNADALNDIVSIDAQAVAVTLVENGCRPGVCGRAPRARDDLEAQGGSGEIKKIAQPYASFGGRPQERPEHFYVRASERLRHKNRAATMWDYEQLVLERFPEVYKVKCINHTELCRDPGARIVADNEVSPGHVLVVPVPYVRDTNVNPLRPYTKKSVIERITGFLRARTSPFVQLEVQNPKIEEVQVAFDVAFTEEIADTEFYVDRLSNEIVGFLTPWAGDSGVEVAFGGKWHKAQIINFVEERSYVDHVKRFEMYHKVDIERETWDRIDEEVIEGTTARSILVSHDVHDITEIGA